MAGQPGKREFRLEFSDRNGAKELEGALADARRIQNVLFGHGRAGDFGLGVDAQSFLHEISDFRTRDELHDKAVALISKYCPDVQLNQLAVDTLSAEKDPRGRKNGTVIIAISLGRGLESPYEFALVARKDSNANVVSTLVL